MKALSCSVLSITAIVLAGCHKEPPSDSLKALATPAATCAVATGKVEMLRPGQPFWEAAKAGSLFRAGDWVRTGKDAYARIEFVSGGNIELLRERRRRH